MKDIVRYIKRHQEASSDLKGKQIILKVLEENTLKIKRNDIFPQNYCSKEVVMQPYKAVPKEAFGVAISKVVPVFT